MTTLSEKINVTVIPYAVSLGELVRHRHCNIGLVSDNSLVIAHTNTNRPMVVGKLSQTQLDDMNCIPPKLNLGKINPLASADVIWAYEHGISIYSPSVVSTLLPPPTFLQNISITSTQ